MEVDMDVDVHQAIRALLDGQGITYRLVHHEPTYTSEDSARVRGEDIRIGGKALVVKTGDVFRIFVLSAARKFDSSAVKKHFGVKSVRFASREELEAMTGLTPGAVPPFGEPILPFELFVDESIKSNERIAFNAGRLTDSIIMVVEDYLRAAQPTVLAFTK
jgi:Ala-tRNA(Pro) deacylase